MFLSNTSDSNPHKRGATRSGCPLWEVGNRIETQGALTSRIEGGDQDGYSG